METNEKFVVLDQSELSVVHGGAAYQCPAGASAAEKVGYFVGYVGTECVEAWGLLTGLFK